MGEKSGHSREFRNRAGCFTREDTRDLEIAATKRELLVFR